MSEPAGPVDRPEREIGQRHIAAGQARTAVIRRRYETPIEDLWEAITDPERMSRWFIKPKGELRVGGTFSLRGNASGTILRCDPPRLLRVSWEYGDQPPDQVEVRLSATGDGATLLELEHATTSRLAPDGSVDAILGFGVGWDLAAEYLARHVRGELPYTAGQEPTQQSFEPTVADIAVMERSGVAWAAALEAAGGSRQGT